MLNVSTSDQVAERFPKGSTMSATATPVRRSRFKTYDEVMKHTEVPLKSRKELAIGRGGAKVKPRKNHLSDAEIERLTLEFKAHKRIPNPHNVGSYYSIWEALILMGVNEAHPIGRVMQKARQVLSDPSTVKHGKTAWQRFAEKEPRNAETGLGYQDKFRQNVSVMQRLTGFNPYGLKMLQVCQQVCGYNGGVLDVLVNEKTGTPYLRLNTKSAHPINQSAKRGMLHPDVVAAAAKAERAEAREADTLEAQSEAAAE